MRATSTMTTSATPTATPLDWLDRNADSVHDRHTYPDEDTNGDTDGYAESWANYHDRRGSSNN
jgi:hypothetical protein